MGFKLKRLVSIILMFACIGIVLGCGGGSGSSGSNGQNEPAAVDISGVWQVEETVDGNCESPNYPYVRTLAYTATQQGNSVTIRNNLEGTENTGTMSGHTVTVSGTAPDGDGSLSINFTGECSQDGESFAGVARWTYNEPGYTCKGTTAIEATLPEDRQVDAGAVWEGQFVSHEASLSGSFTASITDTNGELSGTLAVPSIGLDDAPLTGTVENNIISFGDIDGFITFVGVITNNDEAANGSYLYVNGFKDEGTWQASRQ